jgi:glyoxylase-like metal-dependent hydrolase (beta-lactamase superfamily II)
MQLETQQFNDHISYLDNGLLDTPGVGSTYVVRGDEIAIVETGTSRCAPNVLDGLRRLGIASGDVRHIVLTHIHMDHAGGTGTLLPHMPDARVYIHSRTAKYLDDPSDLLASAERALADLFPLHGGVDPVPAERIVHADELKLDLGRGVVLRAIATPGHSPDHLSYWEESSHSLFTGDAIGISIGAAQFDGPVTPPPALNLHAQRATFEKLLQLPIDTLLFSHYGPSDRDPRQMIEHLRERWEQIVAIVRRQWQASNIDMAAVVREMYPNLDRDSRSAAMVQGWIEMSVRGLVVAFDREAKKAQG